MMSRFADIVENHKLVRRTMLVFAGALTAWTTHQMFSDISAITPSNAAAYATQYALATLVAGYYFKKRAEENKLD